MNRISLVLFALLLAFVPAFAQDTVIDYDGNVYHTVVIGTQTWMRENFKSLHYTDGTLIPDAAAYNDSDSYADIYGRLYTWSAAMHGSTAPGAQGMCPSGWHIPSDAEWTVLENYLGGAPVAGGKMKDTTAGFWDAPNTGADNSSGFTALPSGEYDAHYSPHVYQYLHQYGTFWTSTQYSSTRAIERYLSYNSDTILPYTWFKVMKYAIRGVKDSGSGVQGASPERSGRFALLRNSPNPFSQATTVSFSLQSKSFVSLAVFDLLGRKVASLISRELPPGNYSREWKAAGMPGGVYFYRLTAGNYTATKKLVLLR